MCFSANLGRHFLKSNNVGPNFCLGFQGFCPDLHGICSDFHGFCQELSGFFPRFSTNQNFCGCACTPCPPTSYTTAITYRRHLESLCKRLTSRVALLKPLANSGWGAGATTLRTDTLTLVHSTAKYCAPVWCRSANTRLTDPAINDALWIVTGCLHPTPADNLPILAGVQPAEFRRKGTTLFLARRALELGHLLHSALTWPLSGNARRHKSRHPFVPAVGYNNSSVHLTTTTEVRRSGRITDGIRSSWTTLPDSVLSSPTPARTWNGHSRNSVGLA